MKLLLRVKRKHSTNEWLVTVEADGQHRSELTYYTDDHQDALDTRVAMANRYDEQGHETHLI